MKITKDQIDFALAPSPSNPLPSLDKLQDIALSKRFDLKVSKDQIESAKESLILAKRMRIPDLNLGVGYSYVSADMNGTGNNQLMQGVYIMPSITLPLYNNYGEEIKKSKIVLEQFQLQNDSLIKKVLINLQRDYEQLQTSLDNLILYKNKLLADSSDVVKMSQRRYEIGKTDLSSVILSQQEYQSVMNGYVNALISYYTAWEQVLNDVGEDNVKL